MITAGVAGLLTTVIVAHFIALVSPGPDFLLVVKSSIRSQKKQALGVAFGIAMANGVYILLCLIGVGAVLATSLVLMGILKVLGGLFLLYVAYYALRSKKSDYAFILNSAQTQQNAKSSSFWHEFSLGFMSGISNPKNIIFYLSLFSVVLTQGVPMEWKIALGLWMMSLVFVWNALIIFVLSHRRMKQAFAKVAFYIDKIAGVTLGLLGLKLLQTVFIETLRHRSAKISW